MNARSVALSGPLWTLRPGRERNQCPYGTIRWIGVGATAWQPCRKAAVGPATATSEPPSSTAAAISVNGSAARGASTRTPDHGESHSPLSCARRTSYLPSRAMAARRVMAPWRPDPIPSMPSTMVGVATQRQPQM